jgi:hypothetical protein
MTLEKIVSAKLSVEDKEDEVYKIEIVFNYFDLTKKGNLRRDSDEEIKFEKNVYGIHVYYVVKADSAILGYGPYLVDNTSPTSLERMSDQNCYLFFEGYRGIPFQLDISRILRRTIDEECRRDLNPSEITAIESIRDLCSVEVNDMGYSSILLNAS